MVPGTTVGMYLSGVEPDVEMRVFVVHLLSGIFWYCSCFVIFLSSPNQIFFAASHLTREADGGGGEGRSVAVLHWG